MIPVEAWVAIGVAGYAALWYGLAGLMLHYWWASYPRIIDGEDRWFSMVFAAIPFVNIGLALLGCRPFGWVSPFMSVADARELFNKRKERGVINDPVQQLRDMYNAQMAQAQNAYYYTTTGGGTAGSWFGPIPYIETSGPLDRSPVTARECDEVLTGWKVFTTPEMGVLTGGHSRWESGTFDAKCQHGDLKRCLLSNHQSLSPLCGIYSYKDKQQATPGTALAEVTNWGIVQKHTGGFKAEHTRIDRIYWFVSQDGTFFYGYDRAEEAAKQLEARYDAPVVFVDVTEWNKNVQEEEALKWQRSERMWRPSESLSLPEPRLDSLSAQLSDLDLNP